MSDADPKKVDDFQLLNTIANGNSSQVWEVRDGGGGIHAIKLLRPDAFKDADQVNTLKHEAKVGQALEHPNIIRVHRFVKTKAHCYMLMEFFQCANLKSSLKNERLPIHARLPRLVENLCTALGYMHEKGWLHHDLKPDNILFNKSGELKLIDFSLAMRRKGSLGKMVGGKVRIVQGTRTYIAPETIKKQYPTVQTDMYSLGITLYEILTGQPPFYASSPNDLLMKHLNQKAPEPSSYNPNVTPEADKVILRLLSKKPANRPKDMAEVSAEFRSLKIFKTDPAELLEQEEARKREAAAGLGSDVLLDSRADAARTEAGVTAPARPTARKPSARALEMARKAGLKIPKQFGGEDEPDQPPHEQQQWHPDWAAYGAQGYPQPGYQQQGYPQQYWPQYPQQQGGQAAPEYYQQYPYPAEGQYPQAQHPQAQSYDPNAPAPPGAGGTPAPQTPQQERREGQPPAQQPQTAPPAGQQPAAQQPAAQQPAAQQPAAQQPAAQQPPSEESDETVPLGQGRGKERHPTQRDVDPDSIPEMEDLPDVL